MLDQGGCGYNNFEYETERDNIVWGRPFVITFALQVESTITLKVVVMSLVNESEAWTTSSEAHKIPPKKDRRSKFKYNLFCRLTFR